MSSLRVLCAANLSQGHIHRFLDVSVRSGMEVHLLERGPALARSELPLASHALWPLGYKRTLTRSFGATVGTFVSTAIIGRRLRSIWQRHKSDVCHVHWVDDRAWHCARAGLRPLVLTAYGSDLNWTRLPDHDPILRRQKAEALAACDLFIADSDDMVALACELAGRELNSLLLPFGIDTELFQPGYEREAAEWRTEIGIPPAARVVLSPRLLRSNYRHGLLLRAFADAVVRDRLDAYIVFNRYLSDQACVDELERIAGSRGIENRVRIIGEVPYERMPVLYAMADLVLNFPELDAFPVTFLECAACERPILTNARPAYRSNGFGEFLTFFHAEDQLTVSRQLSTVLAEPRKATLAAARTHVARCFDQRTFVSQLLGAYASALAIAGPPRYE